MLNTPGNNVFKMLIGSGFMAAVFLFYPNLTAADELSPGMVDVPVNSVPAIVVAPVAVTESSVTPDQLSEGEPAGEPGAVMRVEESTPAATPVDNIEKLPLTEDKPAELKTISTETVIPNQFNTPRTETLRTKVNSDKLTGALLYSYSFEFPPGRNGQTPGVSLNYNNQNNRQDSIVGFGWSLDIPYIERINKRGVESMYQEKYFNSSFDGELIALQEAMNGDYRAKIENGGFNKYIFSSDNTWTVYTKTGVRYIFGLDINSRQQNPTSTTRVYKWFLSKIYDTNGNSIYFEYTKDNNQIYPFKITYSNYGSLTGPFEINFTKEARSDIPSSYAYGYLIKTSYRISEILTKYNGTQVSRVNLSYATGINGKRSLLKYIYRYARDEAGAEIAVPRISFDYTVKSEGWTTSTAVNIPFVFTSHDGSAFPNLGQLVDVNGDTFEDYMRGQPYYQNTYMHRASSTGWDGYDALNPYTSPVPMQGSLGQDVGTRIFDINGDGLADVVKSQLVDSLNVGIYLNTGSTWLNDSSWTVPIAFADYNHPGDYGVRLADVNGDGFLDILRSYYTLTPTEQTIKQVYIARPELKTWVLDTNYVIPVIFYDDNLRRSALMTIADVNNDGLDDLTGGTNTGLFSYINKGDGTGWALDASMPYPTPMGYTYESLHDTGTKLVDINGDGLPDVLKRRSSDSDVRTFINTGAGWDYISSTIHWLSPAFLAMSDGRDYGTRFTDINGDGQKDIVVAYNYDGDDYKYALTSDSTPSDLLNVIIDSTGAQIEADYKYSANYRDASNNTINAGARIGMYAASDISIDDGFGNVEESSYIYEGGKYNYVSSTDRQFAGFAKVTQADTAGNKTITYFHQGDISSSTLGEYNDHASKIGRPYRVETYDSAGNLYAKQINRWDRYDLGSGRSFVKQIQSVDFTYDGNSTHKDKAVSSTYDNTNGNLLSQTNFGEVTGADSGSFTDTGTDKFLTTYTYAASSTGYLPGFVSNETVKNQSNIKVAETKYYYDNLAINLVNKGNRTKVEQWTTTTKYIDYEKTFNTYGLVTQEKDPRDNATNYVYDSYNLYPASATNPLSHVTSFLYNYGCGQVKKITDPNLFVTQKTFDGLCRLTEEKMSDPSVTSALITKTAFVYNDMAGNLYTKRSDYLSSTMSVDNYTYYDGLWREIQARKKAENSTACSDCYLSVDTVYNNLGQVLKKSLPYFSSGASRTSAATPSSLYTNFTYDALSRPTAIQNAVGTTYNAYDDWTLTVTDPRGNLKYLYKDALGNLTSVKEKNGASTYTTNYLYGYFGSLTKITDSLSNIRNFTYDGIGRRLTVEDLHASGDTYFGKWIYQYDDAGNLATTTDPNGSITTSTYDVLNRPLKLDNSLTAGVEETYTYDNPAGGKGRLWTYNTDSTQGVLQGWDYFNNGSVKVAAVNLAGKLYRTNYTYDRQGNRLTIANPDLSQIKYTYNIAGLAETITYKTPTGTVFSDIIKNIDYSPASAPTVLVYANNATTTNIYDSSALYRLSNKKTESKIGSVNKTLQEFKYTYDAGGNITQIISNSLATSTRATSTYTYDPLNRLLTAVNTSASSALSYSQSFTYSAIGNILTKSDQGTYTYAGNTGTNYANPHAASAIGTTTFAYDKNGNVVTSTAEAYQYFWDYKNRLYKLTATSTPATTLYNYYYNNDNVRVRIKQGTTNTHYPSKEFTKTIVTTSNSTTVRYIYFGGDLVAEIISAPTSTKTYFVHTDHLGSPTIMTTASGTVAESLAYRPYGQTNVDEKSSTDNLARKFLGEYFDIPTDLSYLNARYYNGKQGRFLGQDPVFRDIGINNDAFKQRYGKGTFEILSNPQELNSYSYGLNNPMVNSDADGQSAISVLTRFVGQFAGPASFLVNACDLFKPLEVNGDAERNGLINSKALSTGISATAVMGIVDQGNNMLSPTDQVRKNYQAGKSFMEKTGLKQNYERIGSFTETAAYRIPDGLNVDKKIISEVKNVNYQRFTNQIKDFLQYAKNKNYRFDLIIRDNAKLSSQLSGLIEKGLINMIKLK